MLMAAKIIIALLLLVGANASAEVELILSPLGSYVYTLNLTVGTPPQPSLFLLDMSSEFVFVFSDKINTLNSDVDAFYDPA